MYYVYEYNTTSIRNDRDLYPWVPSIFTAQQVASAIAFLRFSAQLFLSCIWTVLCLHFGSELSHRTVANSNVAKSHTTMHASFSLFLQLFTFIHQCKLHCDEGKGDGEWRIEESLKKKAVLEFLSFCLCLSAVGKNHRKPVCTRFEPEFSRIRVEDNLCTIMFGNSVTVPNLLHILHVRLLFTSVIFKRWLIYCWVTTCSLYLGRRQQLPCLAFILSDRKWEEVTTEASQ
jgi:hypothetical protein